MMSSKAYETLYQAAKEHGDIPSSSKDDALQSVFQTGQKNSRVFTFWHSQMQAAWRFQLHFCLYSSVPFKGGEMIQWLKEFSL
jgi:hypothetical protein